MLSVLLLSKVDEVIISLKGVIVTCCVVQQLVSVSRQSAARGAFPAAQHHRLIAVDQYLITLLGDRGMRVCVNCE